MTNQNRAFSELYYLRGMIFEKQGDTATAQTMFELANQYNITSSWRENVDLIQ